jgi:hypothetical protein
MSQFEYQVRVQLASGRKLRSAPFLTRKERHLGDVVRLPVRPADGELQPGDCYDWRVTAVEDDGTLVLGYEFPTAA